MTTTKQTRRTNVPAVRAATLTAWVNAEARLAAFVQREDNFIEGEELRTDAIVARRNHRSSERDAGLVLSDTVEQAIATENPRTLEHSDDPMVSVTEQYTIFHHFQEEERGPIVSEMIANNAYEAIANAMALVKPYSGEMFTATWFDCNGTKREVSVKVLDRK